MLYSNAVKKESYTWSYHDYLPYLLLPTDLILPHLSMLSSVGPRRLVDDSDNQSIHA